MQGFDAHHLIAESPGARLAGSGWMQGRLLNLGEYPGAIRDGGRSRVFGEVWDLPTGSLRKLDAYEEYFSRDPSRSLFSRERATIHVGRKVVDAWTYVIAHQPPRERVISNGRWRPSQA